MKVLEVVEQGAPSSYLRAAFLELHDRGVEVHVVSLFGRGRMHDDLEAAGIPTTALGLETRLAQLAAPPLLVRVIRRVRPDVVHAHETLQAAFSLVTRPVAPRGTRFAYHRHHGVTTGLHAAISRAVARHADLTVAISAFVADCARELDRVPEERLTVTWNGVPPVRDVPAAERATLRATLGIAEDTAVVVVVARLRREKGHLTLFAALPGVARAVGRDVRCLVVGDGPLRDELRAAAAATGAAIDFVGPTADVSPWYSVADVAVVPSTHEPFGLVAIEAMAAGRPLVASAHGGLCEIVDDGRSGLLVAPGDVAALEGALVRVLRDPALASGLAAGGRARYDAEFTTSAMVDRWSNALDRLRPGHDATD